MPGPVSEGVLEAVVIPRKHRLADDFEVRGALPSHQDGRLLRVSRPAGSTITAAW